MEFTTFGAILLVLTLNLSPVKAINNQCYLGIGNDLKIIKGPGIICKYKVIFIFTFYVDYRELKTLWKWKAKKCFQKFKKTISFLYLYCTWLWVSKSPFKFWIAVLKICQLVSFLELFNDKNFLKLLCFSFPLLQSCKLKQVLLFRKSSVCCELVNWVFRDTKVPFF